MTTATAPPRPIPTTRNRRALGDAPVRTNGAPAPQARVSFGKIPDGTGHRTVLYGPGGIGKTTLAAEYAKAGLDWESELRQRGREVALMRELGLTSEQVAPGAANDDMEDEGDVTEDEDARQAA